jgi:hypothetical protein
MFNVQRGIRPSAGQQRGDAAPWVIGSAIALVGLVAVLWLVLMTWGRAVAWDEVEFFRATDWIRQGRVPYRDFWEHHFPLQWVLMAWPSGWIHSGGAAAIVWMRWLQVPFWAATGVALCAWLKGVVRGPWVRFTVLGLLGSCLFFATTSVEYRQDTVSTCFLVLALLALDRSGDRRGGLLSGGILLGLAVLANTRVGPLAILAGLLHLLSGEQGWGFRPRALWILAGGGLAAVAAVAAMVATGSLGTFWNQCVAETRLVGLLGTYGRDLPRLLTLPLRWPDVPAILFGILAAMGGWKALARIREGGLLQRSAILSLAMFAQLLRLPATYIYHFQIIMVLACPLVASALEGRTRTWPEWRLVGVSAGLGALALVNGLLVYDASGNRADLRYQDFIMKRVNEITRPGDKVWDTCGYAFRREPAFYRWFIPVHIRQGIRAGRIPGYTLGQMRADPPAAVILTARSFFYLLDHPDLLRHAISHYLPVERNLWLPGLSVPLGPSLRSYAWTVPATAVYRIYARPELGGHPWFRDPLACAFAAGPGARALEVALGPATPGPDGAVRWTLNGAAVEPAKGTLDLRKGDALAVSLGADRPVGIFLVPEGIPALFHPPADPRATLDPELVPPGLVPFPG